MRRQVDPFGLREIAVRISNRGVADGEKRHRSSIEFHPVGADRKILIVEPDVPFAELIDAGTIQVMDVQTHFEGQVPSGIDAGDQVVLFSPSALGRRLLAGLGSRMLVVRPGPTPLVIAR